MCMKWAARFVSTTQYGNLFYLPKWTTKWKNGIEDCARLNVYMQNRDTEAAQYIDIKWSQFCKNIRNAIRRFASTGNWNTNELERALVSRFTWLHNFFVIELSTCGGKRFAHFFPNCEYAWDEMVVLVRTSGGVNSNCTTNLQIRKHFGQFACVDEIILCKLWLS